MRYIRTFSIDYDFLLKTSNAIDANLNSICFICQEIDQAVKAMEELQGTTMPSSDRGGMHIE